MLGERRELDCGLALGERGVDDAVEPRALLVRVVPVVLGLAVVDHHDHDVAEAPRHVAGAGVGHHHRQAALVGKGALLKQGQPVFLKKELRIREAPRSKLGRRVAHVREQLPMNAGVEVGDALRGKAYAHRFVLSRWRERGPGGRLA